MSKVYFKPGVLLTGMEARTLRAIADLAELWNRFVALPFTVTAVKDGLHKVNSLHYVGLAFDFRTKGVPAASLEPVFTRFTKENPDWELLHESLGDPNQHGHLEFDPGRSNR